jgi:hypothetical protein
MTLFPLILSLFANVNKKRNFLFFTKIRNGKGCCTVDGAHDDSTFSYENKPFCHGKADVPVKTFRLLLHIQSFSKNTGLLPLILFTASLKPSSTFHGKSCCRPGVSINYATFIGLWA